MFFGVDISSSSHADNRINIFLVLGESLTFGISGSFGSSEKNFSINFSKANTNLCLGLYSNVDNSYLLVNGRDMLPGNSILSWKYM